MGEQVGHQETDAPGDQDSPKHPIWKPQDESQILKGPAITMFVGVGNRIGQRC